jgi:hypothetical protein
MRKDVVLKRVAEIGHTFTTRELSSLTYDKRIIVDSFLLTCVAAIGAFLFNPSTSNLERLMGIGPSLLFGIDMFKNMSFSTLAEIRERNVLPERSPRS